MLDNTNNATTLSKLRLYSRYAVVHALSACSAFVLLKNEMPNKITKIKDVWEVPDLKVEWGLNLASPRFR